MNYDTAQVNTLQHLYGYNPPTARFFWLVAHFSGAFFRSQLDDFLVAETGYTSRNAGMLAIQHATDIAHIRGYLLQHTTSGRLRYHLYAKNLYRQLGQPNSNYRRDCGETTFHVRLTALDYVLANLDLTYLLTEQQKTDYFLKAGVPEAALPVKAFTTASTKNTEKALVRFVDKYPMAVDKDGQLRLTYVDVPGLTVNHFDTHLSMYAPLLSSITVPWSMILVAAQPDKIADYERLFVRRFLSTTAEAAPDPQLLRYFELHKAVEAEDFDRIGQAGANEHFQLRKTFGSAHYDALYSDWLAGKALPSVAHSAKAPCEYKLFVAPSLLREK